MYKSELQCRLQRAIDKGVSIDIGDGVRGEAMHMWRQWLRGSSVSLLFSLAVGLSCSKRVFFKCMQRASVSIWHLGSNHFNCNFIYY